MKELTKRQKNIIAYLNTRLTPNAIRQLWAVYLAGLPRQINDYGQIGNYHYCPHWAKAVASRLEHDELDEVIEKIARNWTNF